MLSHLFRGLNRQTLKSLQTQNYVKRFYANQDLNHKNPNEDKEYSDKYSDCDETSRRVDEEYYRRYYDTKFDNNSSDRQTDDNKNGHKYRNDKNNEKFNSNSYSFSECKYHLLTLRLLERVGYFGAAIVVGLHFDSPIYYSRQRAIRYNCELLDTTTDKENGVPKVCGQCKTCSAFFSKLSVLSAPNRGKNYALAQNNKFLELNESKITEEDPNSSSQQSNDSSDGIQFTIKNSSDPIDAICRQLETASIDYIDSLSNMLGISLIETDPEEAMRCWHSTKTNSKEALFNMGVAYEKGSHMKNGTPDLKQAYEYYVLSASMGHKLATFNLSLFYLQGKGGIGVDFKRAESLLRKAAQMGVKTAEKYIHELEQRRRVEILRNTQTMRSSASAPNLLNACFESYKNENHNKYSHNYSIANKV